MSEMKARGEAGSIVTVICDGGERYLDTYYNDAWRKQECPDLTVFAAYLKSFIANGRASLQLQEFETRTRFIT